MSERRNRDDYGQRKFRDGKHVRPEAVKSEKIERKPPRVRLVFVLCLFLAILAFVFKFEPRLSQYLHIFQYLKNGEYHAGDVKALRRIKRENDHSGNLNWSGWNPGSWEGVLWSGGQRNRRVLALDMKKKDLTGTLSLAGLPDIQSANVNSNRLMGLDVSMAVNLVDLRCTDNELRALDVTSLVNLEILYCSHNKLTTLDLAPLKELRFLHCGVNRLKALGVNHLTKLEHLWCNANDLKSLDVSGLHNLESFTCSYNDLTELDVTSLVNLDTLYCDDNKLTELDVSPLKNLHKLTCNDNLLTELDITGLTKLKELEYAGNEFSKPISGVAYR